MTPEHKFELLITGLSVVPATFLSVWALISQRRQVQPRLEVIPSPILAETAEGKRVLESPQWPGIVVRNVGPFRLRICNIGYRIGKRFYTFGKPLLGMDECPQWPWEIEPRTRVAFNLNLNARDGRLFANAIASELKGKFV